MQGGLKLLRELWGLQVMKKEVQFLGSFSHKEYALNETGVILPRRK